MKNAAILAMFLVLAMAEGTEKNQNTKNAEFNVTKRYKPPRRIKKNGED